jgi:hypothetical protein
MLVSTDQVSVTADEIVNEVMGDTYDDAGVLKEKYYRWLFRVWTSLNFDFIRTKREMIIPVYPGTNTISFPPDYMELIFFGFFDDCGNLIPLHQNRNLAPDISRIDDVTKLCGKCGQVDLCKAIDNQQIQEEVPAAKFIDFKGQDFVTDDSGTVIYPWTVFYKTTLRQIYPDGSFIQYTKEPYATVDHAGVFKNVGYLQDQETLCKLEKGCSQCVTASQNNLSMLKACCCTDAMMCCSDVGFTYPVVPGIAHYNLFEEDRYIKLSPNNCLNKVYMKYVSTGVCKNGVYIFPLVAEETLIEGTYYLSIAKKKNIPQVEKERARRSYIAAQKILVRRLTRLSYQEWLDIVDAIPRIPSL